MHAQAPFPPKNVNEAANQAIFGVYTVRRLGKRADTLNTQSKSRQARIPWARRVLGAFVVVCLNMALQPCAMAFGGDHDCVHCPPAITDEGA